MYDLIIIGAGPAGLSAGIYASRGGLKTLILESMGAGGQMNYTYEVANYPGANDNPTGAELAKRMREQALLFGCEISNERVLSTDSIQKSVKYVKTRKNTYETKTILFATGASAKKLGVEGEDRFSGMGVSYCAACDGAFFKGQVTAVAGGGNSAFEEAVYLSRFCKKVYIINRSEHFKASHTLIEKAKGEKKIEIITNSVIEKICGDSTINKLNLKDSRLGVRSALDCSGLFVAIGRVPFTDIIPFEISRDDDGFIKSDEFMRTNISGVYVAGDVRHTPLRQIVTAVSDGAVAAVSAINYINERA